MLNIAKIFFLLTILCIFLPIRYIFYSPTSYTTGIYSDFTTLSLYLFEIFLLISTFFTLITRGKQFYHVVRQLIWLILWIILISFFHVESNTYLETGYIFKLILAIVAYGTGSVLWEETKNKKTFLHLFIGFSALESLLSLYQFIFQKSLGLYKLGEPLIKPLNNGLAKIIVSGETYVRGYGTFPHPNILSMFLVFSTLIAAFLIFKTDIFKTKIFLTLAITINILGLFSTFSRAGILSLLLGLTIILGYNFYSKVDFKKTLSITGVLFLTFFVSILVFKPFILTRATITDQAVIKRGIYNQIGLNIIKNHPLIGIGAGQIMIHMQQYSPTKLLPWDIQPIHNYFILAAAELGIVGMFLLLWIFLDHIKNLFLKLKENYFNILLLVIIITFLFLMQFDHYFYTLDQARYLLWITLGVIAAETKTPSQI